MLSLDHVVYITGASSGLGQEMAKQLGGKGAKLALFARRPAELEAAAAAARAAGASKVDTYVLDVTDGPAVQTTMALAAKESGPCGTLFLNAGIETPMSARRFSGATVASIYAVNVIGAAHCLEAVLPSMMKARRGTIVGISSLSAYAAMPGMFTYASSKSALSALLEGLRMELKPRGVEVLTMCPGFIRTPMTAGASVTMPMMIEVDDAAARILRATAQGIPVYDFPRPMALALKWSKALLPSLLARGWQRMATR